jgi:hypothetical protein
MFFEAMKPGPKVVVVDARKAGALSVESETVWVMPLRTRKRKLAEV